MNYNYAPFPPRPEILELCDSLESNKDYGPGRILARWLNKQPWRDLACIDHVYTHNMASFNPGMHRMDASCNPIAGQLLPFPFTLDLPMATRRQIYDRTDAEC